MRAGNTGENSGRNNWIPATTRLAKSSNAIPQISIRAAVGCPAISRAQKNEPTVDASKSMSDCPNSATGETEARSANQPVVMIPIVTNPRSAGGRLFLKNDPNAGNSASPRAIIAGPHVHDRSWAPIMVANANAITRKMEETAGTGK